MATWRQISSNFPRIRVAISAAVFVFVPLCVHAQTFDSFTSFRIFLKDGRAIPSYGEYATLGDRIVFVLPIGAPPAPPELQLVSMPVGAVDVERTARYADGVRARNYAETRGPAEYSTLTVEVSEILASIEREADAKRRLTLAEDARTRLRAWPNSHYGFRAVEIRDLIAVFDEVIADMHRSAVPSGFAVELMAGPVVPQYEPALPTPTPRESIDLALAAAASAFAGSERLTILRRALAATEARPEFADVRGEISRRLEEEGAADQAYAQLADEMTARAAKALARGDVSSLSSLQALLSARDRALGSKRPEAVQEISARLEATRESARAYRLALDHWFAVRRSIARYEFQVRPIFTALDRLEPLLQQIREQSGPEFDRLERARARITTLLRDLQHITAPQDLDPVHSTLLSALFVARDACDRRREAVIGRNMSKASDAAAAAAGTSLLVNQARADLTAQVRRPTLR